MQIATANNLLNMDSLSLAAANEKDNALSHRELYQQIVTAFIKGIGKTQDLVRLGERLVWVADHALNLRQTETAESISQILINAPLPREYTAAGRYFHALCALRRDKHIEACSAFEKLAESPAIPLKYRALSLQSLGFVQQAKYGNLDEALNFYLQAGHTASQKHGNDLLAFTVAQWMIAVVKTYKGDHTGGLADIEKLSPFVRSLSPSHPFLYYCYFNSLAVELGEVGRSKEALRASDIALASPYAHAHPEWRETRDDIISKSRPVSRSIIAGVARPIEASNVTYLSFAEHTGNLSSPQTQKAPLQRARIIRFEEWNKMSKEPNTSQAKLARAHVRQMTISEKQAALLKLIYADNVSEELLDKLLKAVQDLAVGEQANS